MKRLILLVLVACGRAAAGDCSVNIHAASKHYVSGDFNEFNPGAGLVCGVGTSHVYSFGGYRNSFSKATYYAGIGRNIHYGFRVSLVYATGYDGKLPSPVSAIMQYRYGNALLTILPGSIALGLEF